LWDRADHWPQAAVLPGPSSAVDSVAFSPNGTAVAAGTADGTVLLWDRARRYLLGRPLTGGSGPVESVAFNPDGKPVANRSFDHSIRLRNVTTPSQDLPRINGIVPYLCALAGQPLTRAKWNLYAKDTPFQPICAGQVAR